MVSGLYWCMAEPSRRCTLSRLRSSASASSGAPLSAPMTSCAAVAKTDAPGAKAKLIEREIARPGQRRVDLARVVDVEHAVHGRVRRLDLHHIQIVAPESRQLGQGSFDRVVRLDRRSASVQARRHSAACPSCVIKVALAPGSSVPSSMKQRADVVAAPGLANCTVGAPAARPAAPTYRTRDRPKSVARSDSKEATARLEVR